MAQYVPPESEQRYRMTDELGGSKDSTGETKESRWVFYGTRAALLDWLPEDGDHADFSNLDSEDSSLGDEWAGEGFKISNVRYRAMNRWVWEIDFTANAPGKDQTNVNISKKDDNAKLGDKEEKSMETSGFTILPEHAGFRKNPQYVVGGEPWLDMSADGWTLADDCPFTVRPSEGQINTSIPTLLNSLTIYLRGNPTHHITKWLAWNGKKVIKGLNGRVVVNKMRLIYDSEGDEYTVWHRAIMMAPKAFIWNVDWVGI